MKIKIILTIFFASTGVMIYGYDFGIINSALLFINHDIPMTRSQISLLGGSVFFGSAFAILLAGFVADFLGRKKAILFTSFIFILSLSLALVIDSYYELLVSRLLQGISVGFISVLVPLYLTETMPKEIRGRAVTAFQLFLTFGILTANYVGLCLSGDGNWRGMFLIGVIPGLIIFFGGFFIEESPYWLFKKNRCFEAQQTILKLNLKHLDESSLTQEIGDGKSSFTETFSKKYSKHMLLVTVIIIFFQLTGINSILEYSSLIFKNTGAETNQLAVLSSSIMSTFLFGGSVIAFIIADKIERKTIVYITNIIMALVLIFIGVLFLLFSETPLKAYVLLLLLIFYISAFAIGIGSYSWVMFSELIPSKIRTYGLPMMLFLNSMVSFITTSIFLPIADTIGYAGVFILCGLFTSIYAYIVYRYVPKITDKSLSEIEEDISSGVVY